MSEELPRFADAQQRYAFYLGDGPRIIAAKDSCGLYVKAHFLSEVMESVVHARERLSSGRIEEARELIDNVYERLRTPSD